VLEVIAGSLCQTNAGRVHSHVYYFNCHKSVLF
jgi:hypothetical protein